MKIFKKISFILISLIIMQLFITGCSNTKDEDKNSESGSVDKKITISYVNWAEGIAMTNLVKSVLEEKMDYEVEIQMADVGPVFTSIANGSSDLFLDAWLPITHESYMEKYGDDIVDLGLNFEGAKIGIVVPEYVTIDSIEELNDNKDKFENRIVGIDSGAGIMKTTDTAIEEYGLDLELVPGSGPTMTAALKSAIDKEEWIAVTGWAPHWKFARYELKFLEDPKGIYGEAEDIHTIARTGFEDDHPEASEFIKSFMMDDNTLGDLMGQIADSDDDPDVVAKEWMENNEDLVSEWLPE
jgi:glycine betaine/proline transport system substrate-binding protein